MLPAFYGTKRAAASALDALYLPEALLCYGLRVLAGYHRYAHYLNGNVSTLNVFVLPGCGSCCKHWC